MVTFNHHKTAKLSSTKQSELVKGSKNIHNNSDNNIKYLAELADHFCRISDPITFLKHVLQKKGEGSRTYMIEL